MPRQIFVNLPVHDLQRSVAFFSSLGFSFNPQFTDDTSTCMVISETSFAMLLTHDKFASFSPHPVSDATKATEVLVALSVDSREEVDDLLRKAESLGATQFRAPDDHGFMYGRAFQDLDGHVWEVFWMDPSAAAGQ